MDRVASHRVRPIDAVQLEVEPASVAHHLALHVAPPDCRRGGAAVGARHILRRRCARVLVVVGRRPLLRIVSLITHPIDVARREAGAVTVHLLTLRLVQRCTAGARLLAPAR